MTVTPFVPTLPAPAPRSSSADAHPGHRPGAAGAPVKRPSTAGGTSSGDADGSQTDGAPDDFLTTLSTALASVAASSPTMPASPTPATPATPAAAPAGGAPTTLVAARSVDESPLGGSVPVTAVVAAPGEPSASASGRAVTGSPLSGAPAAVRTTAAPGPTPAAGVASATAVATPDGGTPVHEAPAAGERSSDRKKVVGAPLAGPATPSSAGGAADGGEEPPTATDPNVDDSSLPVNAPGSSVAVTGGSAPAALDARPTTERTTAVLRQVFPEVTRVASQAGAGTHRLSITLHPDTLGEVKVTLVVRAGAVHVSLAADSGAAHDALLQGAPQLHRLLEATGGDARVVVRDASSTPDPSTDQRGSDPRGSDQRGQQPPSTASSGQGRDGRDADQPGRSPARTSSSTPVDDPTSPRGRRPGSAGGANPTRTAVHPGRLDRLM
jgi:flagellar hook-length control protein FliK